MLMMKCPRCSHEASVKNGTRQGKQRYRCRGCGCTYTQSWSGKVHPQIKQMAILLHLNGLGFRRIGQVLGVSHVSVQRWWRHHAEAFQPVCPAAGERFETVELDELWHWHKKKRKIWLWLAVDRASGRILAWQLGSRGKKSLKRLLAQLARFHIGCFATDSWKAYRLIVAHRRIQSKQATYTVEGVNSRFRHFFARFHRKTFCYTKSLAVLYLSIPLYVDYLNARLSI